MIEELRATLWFLFTGLSFVIIMYIFMVEWFYIGLRPTRTKLTRTQKELLEFLHEVEIKREFLLLIIIISIISTITSSIIYGYIGSSTIFTISGSITLIICVTTIVILSLYHARRLIKPKEIKKRK